MLALDESDDASTKPDLPTHQSRLPQVPSHASACLDRRSITGGYYYLCRGIAVTSRPADIPPLSALSAANGALTGSIRPPSTCVSCSTTTPRSSFRAGNSPESATSPPETQHSRCLQPSEPASDGKQHETPPDSKRRQGERKLHSGRVRALALRAAALAEVVQRGGGRRPVGLGPFQDQAPDRHRADSLPEERWASASSAGVGR
jgi:hypothetical protein